MIEGIQALRGLAALLVACAHLPWDSCTTETGDYQKFIPVTFSGVDIFFVISGVVMMVSCYSVSGYNSAFDFLSRRMVRIIPLYWICSFIGIAQFLADRPYTGFNGQIRRKVFTSLFLLPMTNNGNQLDFAPLIVQGWTLEYEVFFYAIFALSIALLPRCKITAVGTSIILICIVGSLINLPTPMFQYSRTNSLEFVYGMVIGKLWLTKFKIPAYISLLIFSLGVFSIVSFAHYSDEADIWRSVVWGIPAAAVVAACTLGPPPNQNLFSRTAELCGNASYSLYLCHKLVYGFWFYVQSGSRSPVPTSIWIFPLLLMSAIVTALVLFNFVERPLNAWLKVRLGMAVRRDKRRAELGVYPC